MAAQLDHTLRMRMGVREVRQTAVRLSQPFRVLVGPSNVNMLYVVAALLAAVKES